MRQNQKSTASAMIKTLTANVATNPRKEQNNFITKNPHINKKSTDVGFIFT